MSRYKSEDQLPVDLRAFLQDQSDYFADVDFATPAVFSFAEEVYEFAKARGRHLAKPIFNPVLRQTHVGTSWTYDGASGGRFFDTKKKAQTHALDNGWRMPE